MNVNSIYMQQGASNSQEIIILLFDMMWALMLIFGACELGERLCSAFDEINDVYDQFVWYLLPRDSQQTFTILLMIAQTPVQLHVFGGISCGRNTFKNVSKVFVFLSQKGIVEIEI